MKFSILVLLFSVTIFGSCNGKIYQRCELAKELFHAHKVPKDQLNQWMCIAQGESSYNTAAINRNNKDRSVDYGLFQINDRYWCENNKRGKGCNVSCQALRDNNIKDDVACFRVVYKAMGYDAWVAWKAKCKGKNLSHFTAGCGI